MMQMTAMGFKAASLHVSSKYDATKEIAASYSKALLYEIVV